MRNNNNRSEQKNITRNHRTRARRADLPRFEPLEPRILLSGDAPCITDIDADNRGLVILQVSEQLQAETVNAQNIQILSAGNDGLLGTDDDTAVTAPVTYNNDDLTITIDAENSLDPNQPYAISVDGDAIRDRQGTRLDAEFNGPGQDTGDGTPGGDLLVFTSPAPDDDLIARITTNQGVIDIRMFPAETPLHVNNFFRYADSGRYDNTIFHRSVDDFVVQGGGFSADFPDYEPIDTFATVQNEPGISNTRGTVALAKLGGDPNSGTSQFFFNISDNSENLDNQNGGFTVFAEIVGPSSLAVADAINDLMTIDASAVQTAFTDLPVTADDVNPNAPAPDSVVIVERAAALLQLTDTPQNQLGGVGNTAETSNPNGQGTVRIIDLSGGRPGPVTNFLNIQWGPSGTINTLTITGEPRNDFAIQIQDADVRSLNDLRPASASNLKFIAAEGALTNIRLAAPIEGFDLSGTTLPGGLTFPSDIDNDGRNNDPLALYVASGVTNQLFSSAGFTGDAVFEGGLNIVNIVGNTDKSDFRVGNNDANASTRLTMIVSGSAFDTGVISDIPINAIIAGEWRNADPERHAISAPSLNVAISRGEFSPPTLTTTTGGVNVIVSSAPTNNANWSIAGDANAIILRDASNLTLSIDGNLNVLQAQNTAALDVSVGGTLNAFITRAIQGGSLTVGSTASIISIQGELIGSIDLNTNGSPNDIAARAVQIFGGASSGQLSWNGTIPSVYIPQDINDFNIGSDNAGAGNIFLARATNSEVNVPNRLVNFTARSFDNSSFSTFDSAGIITFNGPFSGDFTATDARVLTINGDASFGTFNAGSVGIMNIRGDLTDSDINFFANSTSTRPVSADSITVTGAINNSTLLFQQSLSSLAAGSMTNSNITVGAADDILSLDDANADDVFRSVQITRLAIGPAALSSATTYFASSTIIAGGISNTTIANPDTNNAGQTFGIAADDIFGLTVTRPSNNNITVNNFNQNPITINDFQIRPDFNAPANA